MIGDMSMPEIGHEATDRPERRLRHTPEELADHRDHRVAGVDHAEMYQPGQDRRSDDQPDIDLQRNDEDLDKRTQDDHRWLCNLSAGRAERLGESQMADTLPTGLGGDNLSGHR